VHVLAELLRLAKLDGEVVDQRKLVEIDCDQRLGIVRAGQLERLRVGEDFQSVGSIW